MEALLKNLTLSLLLIVTTNTALADICGLVKTNQGRAAANIIDAQVAKKGMAVLVDDFGGETTRVKDARVSSKNSFKMDGSTYFPLIVTELATGKDKEIDIGHTWLVIGDYKISLEALTGCGGGFVEDKDAVQLNVVNARAE